MKVQFVSYNKIDIKSSFDITTSTLDKPKALDMFDVNIFSLQDERIWKYEGKASERLNSTNDFLSIKKMINTSQKAINIIALPQNYVHKWHALSSDYFRKCLLKDEIDNLRKYILPDIVPERYAQTLDLIYEISETDVNGSTFESDFCFVNQSNVLTESKGSQKATTVVFDKLILTTLNLQSTKSNLDDFIKGIGLVKEKTEIPEWLVNIDCFDDVSQKASIAENEAKIVELNGQIANSKAKIEENLKYKSILITNSNELVEVVFEMLEKMLDCDLSKFIDEKREDFVIEKEGFSFVGEIKGVNSNVKYANVSQTDTHCKKYMDVIGSGKNKTIIKGLLIINTFRKLPLDEREPINQEQIELAKKYDVLIITTETFLRLYEMFIDGLINCETIIDRLRTKDGVLQVSDFTQNTDDTVDNSAYVVK